MSWPSIVCTSQPMASKRLRGVFALRRVRHRVERHVVRVVDEDQVIEPEVPGEGARFRGHAFLHAAVAGEADDVLSKIVCSAVLNRAAAIFSETAMPTALPTPWPSGPVVHSTPGVS